MDIHNRKQLQILHPTQCLFLVIITISHTKCENYLAPEHGKKRGKSHKIRTYFINTCNLNKNK